MKIGDLVRHVLSHYNEKKYIGVICKEVTGIRGCRNQAFKVVWADGTISSKVWDYDLVVINESR